MIKKRKVQRSATEFAGKSDPAAMVSMTLAAGAALGPKRRPAKSNELACCSHVCGLGALIGTPAPHSGIERIASFGRQQLQLCPIARPGHVALNSVPSALALAGSGFSLWIRLSPLAYQRCRCQNVPLPAPPASFLAVYITGSALAIDLFLEAGRRRRPRTSQASPCSALAHAASLGSWCV